MISGKLQSSRIKELWARQIPKDPTVVVESAWPPKIMLEQRGREGADACSLKSHNTEIHLQP